MFGRKKKVDPPTGAKEKIALAKKMRDSGHYNINLSNSGGDGNIRYPSQTIPLTIIYCTATILAMLLTDGSNNPLAGLNLTGVSSIDHFVGGTDIASFTSDADQNRVLTIMGRGMAFFLIAGIVPAVAFVLEKFLFYKRVTPFLICWGVIITALLVQFCIPLNTIIPFLRDLVGSLG